jgi:hypothetical protein
LHTGDGKQSLLADYIATLSQEIDLDVIRGRAMNLLRKDYSVVIVTDDGLAETIDKTTGSHSI